MPIMPFETTSSLMRKYCEGIVNRILKVSSACPVVVVVYIQCLDTYMLTDGSSSFPLLPLGGGRWTRNGAPS